MRRAVRIDLQAAADAGNQLAAMMKEGVKDEEISDAAVERVGTVIRNLNSALDKTANGVQTTLFGRSRSTYYPLAGVEADFEATLERNIPGLRASHPEIADAFKRHQPFQRNKGALAYLKPLYREYAHHDFVRQVRKVEGLMGFSVGGMNMTRLGQSSLQIGGSSWYGFPLDDEATVFHAPPEMGLPMSVAQGTFVDWHFSEPDVSVLDTLRRLFMICGAACDDVAKTAGLTDD